LIPTAGNLGAAQPWTVLCDVLDRTTTGRSILIVVLADGVDAIVLRTTAHLADAVARRRGAGAATVAELVDSAQDVDYARFLTWRGHLRREPPRRPDPERPGAPATWRSGGWRGGFEASRCLECGFRHLPPTRVCLQCRAVDRMTQERLADVPGRVVTFTVDRLAYSPSPPVIGVVVDFEGGGRYRCQLTDADPDSLEIGLPVEMTFRRVSTAQGVHNYFWKARPAGGTGSGA
jgi:hydroxymethylglutaryl-CoA synthase